MFTTTSTCTNGTLTLVQLVELSKAQDIEAGDGTTTVCVLAGALLGAVSSLMARGIHPMSIAEAFTHGAQQALEVLNKCSIPLDLNDRESLLKSAITALNSKVC